MSLFLHLCMSSLLHLLMRPPCCLFTLLACSLLHLRLHLLAMPLLHPLCICHVVLVVCQSSELLQLRSGPVCGHGCTGSGGSSLRGRRHGNERVRKLGVETKKPVCSYRSLFCTQTMDSGLCIVLSNHTAASWWASWVQPLRGGYCQDHVQLWTVIRLLRLHRSTTAQLRTSMHHSGPRCAHTLPLSATLHQQNSTFGLQTLQTT